MDEQVKITYMLLLSKHSPWADPLPHQRLRYLRGTLIFYSGEGDGINEPAPTADWIEQYIYKA